MPTFFDRYATPFISGLFIVSLVSGVALFFHVGQAAFHGMHEWLSMVLILPFILHLWKNWRPLLNYFRRAPFWIGSVVSLVAALVFAWPALTGTAATRSGPPPMAFATKMMDAAPQALAPALGKSTDDVVKLLTDAGFAGAAADKPLKDIAAAAGKSSFDVMSALTK